MGKKHEETLVSSPVCTATLTIQSLDGKSDVIESGVIYLTRAFLDQDVQARPDLAALARDYLSRYQGCFPVLVNMKARYHASDETMTIPHARVILNCMRTDPNVTNLPDVGTRDATYDANAFMSSLGGLRGSGGLSVERRTRKDQTYDRILNLRSRYRFEFVMSSFKTAKKIHIIEPFRALSNDGVWYTSVIFHRRVAWGDRKPGYFIRHTETHCSTRVNTGLVVAVKLDMANGLITDGDRRACSQCAERSLIWGIGSDGTFVKKEVV